MIRLGLVDFDSSHSIEFARRLNRVGVEPDEYVEGARIVLGWPGDSDMSPERIPLYTPQVAQCGVELVDSPADMLGRIDAVLVLSLCGARHLERVRPFLEAGIPAFVDKPFACSLADAQEMVRLAAANGTFLFSSSALRFAEEIAALQSKEREYGPLRGAFSYGPGKRAEGNPGLFHYGIHAVEVLFTLMGPDCETVGTFYSVGGEIVTGRWNDGRLGTVRASRTGATAYGFTAFCEAGVITKPLSTRYSYRNLCRAIVRAFEEGKPAVDNATTLAIVRFILASRESESRGGTPIRLDSLD